MLPDLATRRKICKDTMARSEAITTSTPNASVSSTFISPQTYPKLSPSDPSFPALQLHPIQILDIDTFLCARSLLSTQPELKQSNIAVLNLASDAEPGGGWLYTIGATQEEALCYSSTLFKTLKQEYYPWANTGEGSVAGILSPGVVVFKDILDKGCGELKEEDRIVVSVVSVAGPRRLELSGDGESFANQSVLHEVRDKIRLVLRCAARERKTCVVLGALGCGAYGCPPKLIAREMKGVLAEEEFGGWFERVVFAVYGQGPTGKRNLEAFKEVFG